MMADVSVKELMMASKTGIKKLVRNHKKLGPAFGGLSSTVLQDGNLTVKTKELLAVGIAVHAGCDFCIAQHVENCLKAGATEEEIAEACGVAILMGGGPAVMYSSMAMNMVEELKE
jgi:AhpD family alkylhydroperoxidase